jgi:DNA/RNA-binding domain of Phe-tRNA-synthetase-like protein
MKFSVSPEIFEMFPDLQIAAAVFSGINNTVRQSEVAELLRNEELFSRSVFSEMKVSEHPNIQSWRKAYTKFGAGSHYRSSVEALAKRVTKGENLPSINSLVDIYNLVSLKHLVPVGGEDLKKIQGNITLTFATGDEKFRAIYAEKNDPPLKGEIVYMDDNKDVLCRRFNWRESEKSKITDKTTKAIIYIEGVPPVNAIETKEAAQDLAAYVEEICGGSAELFLINKNFPKFTFTK